MGFHAAQWMAQQSGLSIAQQAILWRASWSSDDETGWLAKSEAWLGEKCGLSRRSLERHLPQLAKLELLVRGDRGFRLPRYLAEYRQIGGSDRQFVRQNVRQFGGAQEEGFLGNVLNTPPLPPSPARGERRLTRAERKVRERLAERSRPRAHWPGGLGEPWIAVLTRCAWCRESVGCDNQDCRLEHEPRELWICEACLEKQRQKERDRLAMRAGK